MKSLKITLLSAALIAVFALTVSGTSGKENVIDKNSMDNIEKSEQQLTGPIKKKNKIPNQV